MKGGEGSEGRNRSKGKKKLERRKGLGRGGGEGRKEDEGHGRSRGGRCLATLPPSISLPPPTHIELTLRCHTPGLCDVLGRWILVTYAFYQLLLFWMIFLPFNCLGSL